MAAVAAPADAQLSKLKKKAKDAVTKKEKEKPGTKPAPAPTPASTTAASVTDTTPPAETPEAGPSAEDNPLVSGAVLVANPDLPAPALTYMSLLDGLQHSTFWRDGKFAFFGNVHGVFLPAVEGDKRYSPYGKGDAILAHQIRKVDDPDAVIQTEVYDGWPKNGPFYEFSSTAFTEPVFEQGDYVVEWFLEGTLFYQMPFTVDVLKSGDEYKPAPRYYLEGPWNTMMTVYQPNGGPSPVRFGFWYRDKSYERDRFTEYWWRIDVKRGGKVVAQLPVQKTRNERKQKIVTGGEDLRPWWQHREFLPIKAGTSNDRFLRDDLKDGNYEVTYALVKEADGRVFDERTYRFSVSGGKIQPAGRQVRKGTEAHLIIDGGEMDGNGHLFFFENIK